MWIETDLFRCQGYPDVFFYGEISNGKFPRIGFGAYVIYIGTKEDLKIEQQTIINDG